MDITELDATFGKDPQDAMYDDIPLHEDDEVVSTGLLPEDDMEGFLKVIGDKAPKATEDGTEVETYVDEVTGETVEVIPVPETTVEALGKFHELPDDMEVSFGDTKASIKDIKDAMTARDTHKEFTEYYEQNKDFLQGSHKLSTEILESSYGEAVTEYNNIVGALQSNPNLTADQKVGAYERLRVLEASVKNIDERKAVLATQLENSRKVDFSVRQETVERGLLKAGATGNRGEVQNDMYNFAKELGMSANDIANAWSYPFVQLLQKAHKAQNTTAEVTKKVFKQTHRAPVTTKPVNKAAPAKSTNNTRDAEGFYNSSEAGEFAALGKILKF